MGFSHNMTFSAVGSLTGWILPAPLGLIGLLVGCVMNRGIERLPAGIERGWWREVAALLDDADAWTRVLGMARPRQYATIGAEIDAALTQRVAPDFSESGAGDATEVRSTASSARPRSLAEPVPNQRGATTNRPTLVRGVAVSLVTGALFAAAAWRFGPVPATLAWCAALALIVAMAVIDWDTRLLPDTMTLSLLWSGLACSTLGWTIPPTTAIWGCMTGFMALWSIAWLFRLATGKEGMGAGDFKLLAALGAWLGWQAILPIALLASVVGVVVTVPLKLAGRLQSGEPIPFGPFLAGAGLLVIFRGADRVLAGIGIH
jgi:leader peptidase (prepilin peptidase)/N-methyltransferase